MLFGIEVAVAHDIKLCMAVNTIKTYFKVNVLVYLSFPWKQRQGACCIFLRVGLRDRTRGLMALSAKDIWGQGSHFVKRGMPRFRP